MDIFKDLKIGPTPEPPSPESVIETVTRLAHQVAAQEPKNWVYVYTPLIAEDQAIVTSPEANLDGKRHVFLNPKHEPKISSWLAEQGV